MKTEKIIIILVLFLTFSCQKRKRTSEIKTDSKIELENKTKTTESDSDNLKPKINSENSTYRKITDLDKYKGFTEIVGMVLDRTEKSLSYIQKDSLQILVLEQIIRDNSSKVNFKILDEVQLIADESKLFSEPTNCELTENPNEKFIFGIVNDQDKEFFDNDHILKVWKVNLVENKFEEIDSKKVKCFNQWFGYTG